MSQVYDRTEMPCQPVGGFQIARHPDGSIRRFNQDGTEVPPSGSRGGGFGGGGPIRTGFGSSRSKSRDGECLGYTDGDSAYPQVSDAAAQKWGCKPSDKQTKGHRALRVQATDKGWTVTKVQSNASRDSSPFSAGSRVNLGAELMEYNTQEQQQRRHTMVHLFTKAWSELVEKDIEAACILLNNHFMIGDDMHDTNTKAKWIQTLYKHAENVNECEWLFKYIGKTRMIIDLFRTVMMYPKPVFYTCIEILIQQLNDDYQWITHVTTDMGNLLKFEPRGAHGTEFESHLVRMIGGICYHFLTTSEKDTFWAVLARTVIKLVGRICSNPPDSLSNLDDDQYYVKTFELLSFLAGIPEYQEEATDILCGMGTVLDTQWNKHKQNTRVANILKAFDTIHTELGGRQAVAEDIMATEDVIRQQVPKVPTGWHAYSELRGNDSAAGRYELAEQQATAK